LKELKCRERAMKGHRRCCGSKATTRQPRARARREK
jgi:hypothetical protein